MHKAYLLLRNNKQTGPYSLEEIIKFDLKPFDLVWVEGKSAGWRYPGEIDTLKASVPNVPPVISRNSSAETPKTIEQRQEYAMTEPAFIPNNSGATKQIFVRMPGDVASVRLDAAPKIKERPTVPLQAVGTKNEAAGKIHEVADAVLNNKYSRSLDDVEKEYTNWVLKSKAKKFGTSDRQKAMILVFMFVGIIGICYALFFKSKVAEPDQLVAVAVPVQKQPATKVEKVDNQPVTNNTKIDNAVLTDVPPVPDAGGAPNEKKIKPNKKPFKKNSSIIVKAPVYAVPQKPITNAKTKMQPVLVAATGPSLYGKTESAPQEKKRGLATAFTNLFARIKHPKQEEQVPSATPARIPGEMPGSRNARKRTEETTANTDQENVDKPVEQMPSQELMEVSGNDKPENNWQLGMYNLKISVHNRNSVGVGRATVSVAYFDENNRVLEKKVLNFMNIPARGTVTMSAPDQKWADHVEYEIVAIK